ncbi:MAG TPA: S9 family peptidase [Thermomicrobiales bacterium]|nr:S9 family peptidase [Thermomicrobiales bacterium]
MSQPHPSPTGEPDDLDATVALMAKIGACHTPSFSPDGARLAFVANLGGIPQVWTVAATGGWPALVTALDDQVGAVAWSPAGDWLACAVAPGGGMNQQIYLVRPDGTGLRRLTGGGAETNWLGPWTRDGRALGVSSNRDGAGAMAVSLIDVASGTWRPVAAGDGTARLQDVSRDGRLAIVHRVVSRGDSDLFLVDLASGREARLTPHEGPGTFGGGHFAPDGRAVYCISNRDRDRTALARARLDADGRPGPLELVAARDDAELQALAVSDDGATAALVWNVAGRSELDFCDLATGARTPVPGLPAEVVTGLDFAPDGRRLALTCSGSAAPSDIWVYDRDTERFQQVTHSPHAGVDLAALVRPELVRFAAHDGLSLSGWLYRPRGASGPGPTVLSFHGGPEGQERPLFNATYQALLARGIAVFAPNVRGSGGFGKTFVNLDNGALRFDGIADIAACADYVVAAGVADPRRIGIMGGSYGGYMTMAGLTEYPERFAAGANLYGVVNFETFFAHTEPWMAAISKVKYGDPDTERDLLRRLSPIHRIDRVVAPVLVLHGANDTNVPVVEAEQVVENLRRRDIPVDYILFPDEGHGFLKTPNRTRATTAVVRWFARYL